MAFVADMAQPLYQAATGLSGWLWAASSRSAASDDMHRRLLRERSTIDLYKGTNGGDYAAGHHHEIMQSEYCSIHG